MNNYICKCCGSEFNSHDGSCPKCGTEGFIHELKNEKIYLTIPCPACDGSGQDDSQYKDGRPVPRLCRKCKGRGTVASGI